METTAEISKETLIEGLNKDLSHEYQAIIMYTTYAAAVTGVHRGELREFFESEIVDEQNHAQYLADKVVALGGTPTTTPAPVEVSDNPRVMLERVLKAESETIERYAKRMKQAEEYGDLGLANVLHDFISDETEHKEETEKILRGHWPKN